MAKGIRALAALGISAITLAITTPASAWTDSQIGATSENVNGLLLPKADASPAHFSNSALTVDRNGGEHVLAYAHPSGDNADGLWEYYTLLPGDHQFTATELDTPADVSLALVRTVDGNSINVAVATCQGVKVFQVPDSARALPSLDTLPASFADTCSSSISGGFAGAPVLGMASLADGRVAVLLDMGLTVPKPAVYIGLPGQAFTKTVMPGGESITSDLMGNHVYVVAGGPYDATTDRTKGASLQTFDVATSSWQRTTITSVKGGGPLPGSIAASHGQVWISYGSVVVHRSINNVWSTRAGLPGEAKGLTIDQLVTAPVGSTPEIWAIESANCGQNQVQEFTSAHGWSGPHRVAGAIYASSVDGASIDWDGRPVFEYGDGPVPTPNQVRQCKDGDNST
jgi:hypothetical protein